MSDKTGITWTDATWNPITGCDKVSAGCKHCYALRDWPRLSSNPKTVYFGRAFTDVAVHPERLDQPLRWSRPRMIFVNSMSDLFHKDVPTAFIDKVLGVAWLCALLGKGHVFQVLTKRADRMRDYFNDGTKDYAFDWSNAAVEVAQGLKWNVHGELVYDFIKQHDGRNPALWLGVSVENQEAADLRVPNLLATPAAVRWISAEPLLGPVSFRWAMWAPVRNAGHLDGLKGIDWMVVGGESGSKARPMKEAWALALRDQCAEAGVCFFFKQWGEWQPAHMGHTGGRIGAWVGDAFRDNWGDTETAANNMVRAGSNALGWNLLAGVEHAEFPAR